MPSHMACAFDKFNGSQSKDIQICLYVVHKHIWKLRPSTVEHHHGHISEAKNQEYLWSNQCDHVSKCNNVSQVTPSVFSSSRKQKLSIGLVDQWFLFNIPHVVSVQQCICLMWQWHQLLLAQHLGLIEKLQMCFSYEVCFLLQTIGLGPKLGSIDSWGPKWIFQLLNYSFSVAFDQSMIDTISANTLTQSPLEELPQQGVALWVDPVTPKTPCPPEISGTQRYFRTLFLPVLCRS